MEVLPPDMVIFLASFLEASDITRVASTCKTLRSQIFSNDKLWRYYVERNFPDAPSDGIRDHEIDWRFLATAKSLEVVTSRLQWFHLEKRLSTEMKSKEFLRFFCKVTTDKGQSDRLLLLTGELVEPPEWKDKIQVVFKHPTRSSFLFWKGENGIESRMHFYSVDRRNNQNQNELPIRSTNLHTTLLSRAQYRQVGKIAYDDENYFGNFDQVEYKFSESHSALRMGRDDSFGSNTRTSVKPNVSVECLMRIVCTISLNELFGRFC